MELTEAYYWMTYFGGEDGVIRALEKYNLDVLILPTDYSPGLPAYAELPVVTVDSAHCFAHYFAHCFAHCFDLAVQARMYARSQGSTAYHM